MKHYEKVRLERKTFVRPDGTVIKRENVHFWNSLTQRDLLKRICNTRGLCLDELSLRLALSMIVEELKEAICESNRVKIDDFGTFSLRYNNKHFSISFIPERALVKELKAIRIEYSDVVVRKPEK
ncbi:MAG: HU family DNA-binding protein [Prevotella sp.]|nr:HU family DNA-binding protein [Prevotella sp.]